MRRVVGLVVAVVVLLLTCVVSPGVLSSQRPALCRQVGVGLVAPCAPYPEPEVCRVRVALLREALPGCSQWDAYIELRARVASTATRQGTVSALFHGVGGTAVEVARAAMDTSSGRGKVAFFESVRIVDDLYVAGRDVEAALNVLDRAMAVGQKVVGLTFGSGPAAVAKYCTRVGEYFFEQFTRLAIGIRLRADARVAYGVME